MWLYEHCADSVFLLSLPNPDLRIVRITPRSVKQGERRPEDMDTFTGAKPVERRPDAAGRNGPVTAGLVGAGISLIVVVGLIHLIDAPEDLAEGSYQGFLFVANFLGALAAAAGIYRGNRWGWVLGFLVAGGAFVGYVISRTAGLPGLPVEEAWLEPLGILSLVVEALFIGLYLAFLARTAKETATVGTSAPDAHEGGSSLPGRH